MTTKANRSKAAQKRIEKAKKVYGVSEANVDNWLMRRFAGSPWALAVSLAALVACIVVLAL